MSNLTKQWRFKLDNFFQVEHARYPEAKELVLAAVQRFPTFFRENLNNPKLLDEVDDLAHNYYPYSDDDGYIGSDSDSY